DRFCACSSRAHCAPKLTVGANEARTQFTDDAPSVAALETAVRRVESLNRSRETLLHRVRQAQPPLLTVAVLQRHRRRPAPKLADRAIRSLLAAANRERHDGAQPVLGSLDACTEI